MNLPDKIKVTFTEEDRQNARSYISTSHCLLATHLRSRGFKNICVTPCHARINKVEYEISTYFGSFESKDLLEARKKPFYDKSVVGTSLTLIRQ